MLLLQGDVSSRLRDLGTEAVTCKHCGKTLESIFAGPEPKCRCDANDKTPGRANAQGKPNKESPELILSRGDATQ